MKLCNITEQPSTGSQENCILVLINICCNRKEHSLNLFIWKLFFTPFLTCLQFSQVFKFLEDKNHVYFIFPHILAQCVFGALPENGVINLRFTFNKLTIITYVNVLKFIRQHVTKIRQAQCNLPLTISLATENELRTIPQTCTFFCTCLYQHIDYILLEWSPYDSFFIIYVLLKDRTFFFF